MSGETPAPPAGLARLNALPEAEARAELERCCGSKAWARAVAAARPFAGTEQLFAAASRLWAELGRADWLEAFAHHPRIGGGQLREKFPATAAWASQEQAGVQGASEEVLRRLETGNDEYLKRFGFVFLICATGKSAAEMLGTLERRLKQSPELEVLAAATEQDKITRIRLEKWLEK